MYSPYNYEENVAKGYMTKTKDPFIGFICVFGLPGFGSFYYGVRQGLESLFYYVGGIICFAIGVFLPVFHAGTLIFSFMILAKALSLVFGKENSYALTAEGLKLQQEWDQKQSQEIKADVEAVKAKAGVFLKNISEKLTNVDNKPSESMPQVATHSAPSAAGFCNECGVKHPHSAKFCAGCGIKIEKVA